MREIELEHRGRDEEHDEGADQAVADREEADPHQVCDTPDWSHEGVLDSALPPLPCDRIRRLHEYKREVAPQERADEQVELRFAQVERTVLGAKRTKPGGQEADRKHAHQAVEEPYALPQPVALDNVQLPLGKAEERIQLGMPYPGDAHGSSVSFASAIAKVFPVRCMKTSSRGGLGVPFARGR